MGSNANKTIRVVMAGPLPPLIGGMATAIEDISKSSLHNRVQLELFNTGTEGRRRFILWSVLSKLRLWKNWVATISECKNTIVHIHTCSGISFFFDGVLLICARIRNRPSVLHIHGGQFDSFLDKLSPSGLWFARKLSMMATAVVVLSDEWREKLSHRLPGSEIRVIENGVPVPDVSEKSANSESVKALFLGNLSSKKGVLDLVDAMTRVPSSVQLLLAGGENEANIGKILNDKIGELGLTGKITWLGPVQGKQKAQLFSQADIFVLPSYVEGLPISLLEAMCAGLPVIVTPVGAVPTVVSQNVEGILVPPGDVEKLSSAIQTLALDPQLRVQLGANARQTCLEKYSIENVVQKYMDLYSDITHIQH